MGKNIVNFILLERADGGYRYEIIFAKNGNKILSGWRKGTKKQVVEYLGKTIKKMNLRMSGDFEKTLYRKGLRINENGNEPIDD